MLEAVAALPIAILSVADAVASATAAKELPPLAVLSLIAVACDPVALAEKPNAVPLVLVPTVALRPRARLSFVAATAPEPIATAFVPAAVGSVALEGLAAYRSAPDAMSEKLNTPEPFVVSTCPLEPSAIAAAGAAVNTATLPVALGNVIV